MDKGESILRKGDIIPGDSLAQRVRYVFDGRVIARLQYIVIVGVGSDERGAQLIVIDLVEVLREEDLQGLGGAFVFPFVAAEELSIGNVLPFLHIIRF